MSVIRWIGRAATVAQVGTITITGYDSGTSYRITRNGKTVAQVGTGGTTTTTAAALILLLQAYDEPEFTEVTWSQATNVITFTVNTAGTPVTFTTSVSGGAGTIGSPATTTANVSPNDAANTTNWQGGALPGNGDTALFDFGDVPVLWNLDALAAVTTLTIRREQSYTGSIGLPEWNPNGYFEDRVTEFTTDGGTLLFQQLESDAPASFKFNFQTTAGTVSIVGTGATELQQERLWFRGTGSNTVNIASGDLAAAVEANNATTVTTLNALNSVARFGQNVTLTTANNKGSVLDVNNGLTTLTHDGDNALTIVRAGTITNAPSIKDGVLDYRSTTTLPAPTVGTNATVDLSQDPRTKTISGTVTMRKGATWNDPFGVGFGSSVAFTSDASPSEYTLVLPAGKTVTVS